MKNAPYSIFALLLIALFLFACDKEENNVGNDKTAPVARLNSPTKQDSTYLAEGVLDIKAAFSDNVALAWRKIWVESATGSATAWQFKDSMAVAGKSRFDTLLLRIPSTAEKGDYRLNIQCGDAAKMVSEKTTLRFYVNNDNAPDANAPKVTLDKPAEGAKFARGFKIAIQGKVTDNQEITAIQIYLKNSLGQNFMEPYFLNNFPTPTSYNLDTEIPLPDTMAVGMYQLKVVASDPQLNSTTVVRNLEIQ